MRFAHVLALVGSFLALSCQKPSKLQPKDTAKSTPSASVLPTESSIPSAAHATPSPIHSAPSDTKESALQTSFPTKGCPEGMIRVEGDYCPLIEEHCLEHHPEWKHNHKVSERCLRFEEPSRCLSKERQHLTFCMDRYEYPNQVGELPWVLISWIQARKLCENQGKRLCTEDEFNFACEGPNMLPHVYGYTRDDSKCNIDKPYNQRKKTLRPYESCLKNPGCAAELARLDQRQRIGEITTCISWSGIYDLNGNVNEWVYLPKGKPPNRSGLKGGWWGPVRNRCRPTVTFHKEEDYGYEAGFRCCKDTQLKCLYLLYDIQHPI